MFITKKKHNEIVNKLLEELRQAKDFKVLLSEIISKTGLPSVKQDGLYLTAVDGHYGWGDINLPDTVPQYVVDIFGGKVIKQDANKGIKIDKNGNVTVGLTAKKKDKGYSYKLVRE